MSFLDDFNRSDESLETDANWTLVDGAANAAGVVSNALDCNSTQSVGSYHCPDQSSANHYTQAAFNSTFFGAGPMLTIRATDGNNFIGFRHQNGAWEIYKRVSGSFSLLGSFSATLTPGDVGYFEADSSDNITGKVNGTVRVGPTSESFNNTETRQGLTPRGQTVSNWIDDFEAGALGGGATANPWYYYAQY